MAYMYSVDFEIGRDQMSQLEIGSALERVLGYLRTALPSEPGFTLVRAFHSVDTANRVRVLVESIWDTWDDLQEHTGSSLAEDKVLQEFEPHVEATDLTVQVFEEID